MNQPLPARGKDAPVSSPRRRARVAQVHVLLEGGTDPPEDPEAATVPAGARHGKAPFLAALMDGGRGACVTVTAKAVR